MATWYGSSVAYAAVAQFATAHAYSVGDIVRQLAAPAVNSERCFRCTTAGTSAGSEPAWNLGKATTTTSNTAVFTEVTGNSSWNTAASMTAPFARVTTALSFAATGDTVLFANNHAETQSTADITTGGTGTATAPILMISIDTSGNFSAGASITTTTSRAISFTAVGSDWWGWTINCGTGATTAGISLGGGTTTFLRFVNSALNKLGTSSASAAINAGNDSAACTVVLENTTVQFGNTGDRMFPRAGVFIWRNTPSAVQGATLPPLLFTNPTFGNHQYTGVDFSALATGVFSGAGYFTLNMVDCKLASGAVPISGVGLGSGSAMVSSTAADSAAREFSQTFNDRSGGVTTDVTIVRTGGASDGVTAFSHKFTSITVANWSVPAAAIPLAYWNTTTGSAVTLTVHGILSAAALPNNDEVWIDCSYLGTAGSTLASSATTTKANILAANAAVTASTQAWDSAVTARANTHAYVLGDFIKVATNPGRVFICTTAGTSAGSEPGGYASAVDGGSVTDNTAVFRAMVRFQLAVTVTPQVIGPIYVTPRVGKASTTYYVDPGMVAS